MEKTEKLSQNKGDVWAYSVRTYTEERRRCVEGDKGGQFSTSRGKRNKRREKKNICSTLLRSIVQQPSINNNLARAYYVYNDLSPAALMLYHIHRASYRGRIREIALLVPIEDL